MCSRCYKVFKLLLYKNLLILKRSWKMALFLEILFPIVLFAIIVVSRAFISKPSYTIAEKIYPLENKEQLLPRDMLYLNIVPDNSFTQSFADNVRKCLKLNHDTLIISRFNTEEDILEEDEVNQSKYVNKNMISVIFENKSIDFSIKDLVYKIQIPKASPTTLYNNKLTNREDVFIKKTVGLQLCLDESFITMKVKDNLFSVLVSTQNLPVSRHQEPHVKVDIFRQLLNVFTSLALLFPLCINISRAYEEKFSGTNVLMSINGVPFSLNILSWLFTGLIFSIFYTVPIIIMLHFFSTKSALAIPLFYYGNPIICWIIITLHVLHLLTVGLHILMNSPKASHTFPAITLFQLFTVILSIFIIKDSHPVFILLGIIFPNVLLHRIFDLINHYENINVGLQWSNLFRNVNPVYGYQGNVGGILIVFFIGIIANYIFCINIYSDEKCGIDKGHFNFLQCFRRSSKDEKIENLKYASNFKEPFEPVQGTNIPIIRIRDLTKYYKCDDSCNETGIYALKNISIDCFQGQITAIFGHEKSGKSTIMSILTGFISPTLGSILINGKNVNDSLDEIIKDVGLCPQENLLYPSLSVTQHLEFFGSLKNRSKSKAAFRESIETLLYKLKLFEKRNALPYELSDGQKRQLCLAIALIGDSSILILDEPTAGLDSACKRDVWDILLKMRGEKTILISTQDMKEADILTDKTVILHDNNSRKKLLENGNIVERDPQKISYIYAPNCRSIPDSSDEIITLEQGFLKIAQDHKTCESRKSFKDFIETLKLIMHSRKTLLRKKIIYTKKILAKYFEARNFRWFLTMYYILTMALILMYSKYKSKSVKIGLDMYNEPYYSFKHDNESELYGINYKIYAEEFNGKRIDYLKEDRNFTAASIELGERYPLKHVYKPLVAAKFTHDFNAIHATALYNAEESQYAELISVNLLTNSLIKTLIGTDHSITISIELSHQKAHILLHDIMNKITVARCYAVAFIFSIYLYTIMAFFVTHPMSETLSDFERLQQMTKLSHFGYWATIFAFDFIVYLVLMLILLFCFIVTDILLIGMFGIIDVLIMIKLIALFGVNIILLIYIFSFAMTPLKNIIKILVLLPIAFVAMELIKNILIEFDIIDKSNIFYRVQKELFSLIPYISFFNAQIAFSKITSTNFICGKISNYFEAEDLCMYNTTCCAMNCYNGTCKNSLNYYNGFSDNISLEGNILRLCLSPVFYLIILNILECKKIQNIYAFEDDEIRINNKIGSEISKIKRRNIS